jgi:protein-disulfide isomerase
VIEYGDYECPYCARADLMLARLPVTRVFRHFPVVSKHPRARVLAHAAEAAALQGVFWEMHDSLFGDQGRLDDPHLWERARRLEMDLERFESDRRSDAVAERVSRDFRAGVRAGVVSTPTLFVDGEQYPGVPSEALLARLRGEQDPQV